MNTKTLVLNRPAKLFNASAVTSPKNDDKKNTLQGIEQLETIFERARNRDISVRELRKLVDREISADKDHRTSKRKLLESSRTRKKPPAKGKTPCEVDRVSRGSINIRHSLKDRKVRRVKTPLKPVDH